MRPQTWREIFLDLLDSSTLPRRFDTRTSAPQVRWMVSPSHRKLRRSSPTQRKDRRRGGWNSYARLKDTSPIRRKNRRYTETNDELVAAYYREKLKYDSRPVRALSPLALRPVRRIPAPPAHSLRAHD